MTPGSGRRAVGGAGGFGTRLLPAVHRLFEQRQDFGVQRSTVSAGKTLHPLVDVLWKSDADVHDLLSHAASVARPV